MFWLLPQLFQHQKSSKVSYRCIICVSSIKTTNMPGWCANQFILLTSPPLGHLTPFPQRRNVISGGSRFKIFEGPLSRSAKGTSWAPYMHEFSMGSGACSPGKFLNLESLKCHFLDFEERFYRILMVRKRHCNISEASLANVFALQPEPGGPHLAHWGWGPPGSPGLNP
jgi:hypothetical protein